MHKKLTPFDLLCNPDQLLRAWRQVRRNQGAPGIDMVTIAEFESELLVNLEDLAARLQNGGYFPMPLRRFEMQKANGRMRSLGIFTVEDRIVQRAALDLLEPLWEPSFLECSYGFRPGRNVEMAVKQVLDYRAAGDGWLVDADILDCFGSLEHEVIMNAVSARVRDKRMLNLLRMWLTAGQIFTKNEQTDADDAPLMEKLGDYATGSVNEAINYLLDERGYGGGYGVYNSYQLGDESGSVPAPDRVAEARKAARREAYKRLGRDLALLGVTFFGRRSRVLSPLTLVVTGAAALATAAYPAATRYLRERRQSQTGAVQGSALSTLLCNIVLHEFDVALTRAGYHLVRYADDLVITCGGEQEAREALAFAARRLAALRLQVNSDKTRIIRFEQGLEFLGYKFDPFLLTAKPAATSTQQPIKLLREAPAALGDLRDKAGPKLAQLAQQAKGQAARVSKLFKKK
jgi:RNA-directed DNA polymerase